MIFVLTDEEKKWVVKEAFNWHIKENCPSQLKTQITSKLELLKIKQGN